MPERFIQANFDGLVVNCADCRRELKDEEWYTERLEGFYAECPVVEIVCLMCELMSLSVEG